MTLDSFNKFTNLDDYLNQEIPPDLANRLKVAGRVEQILKDTKVSAVSVAGDQPIPDAQLDEINKEIDELIDSINFMEDLVEQLEDMSDDQLKNMAIPPATPRVAAAAKSLGSPDGTINKDVLDQALLIDQVAPMLLTGTDPVAAALTGQGIVDPNSGTFLNCNEITRALVKELEFLQNSNINNPNISLSDLNQDISAAHEDSMARMMLEIILKLIWNILWVKMVVDHAIINPARVIVANPLDSIILFFSHDCGRFKKPSSECREQNGPINKLLNQLRNTLICKVPPKFYKRFNPMDHDVVCPKKEFKCPESSDAGRSMENDSDTNAKGSLNKMTEIVNELFPDACVDSDMLLGLARCSDPSGPGLPPECYNSAIVILSAILDNSLNPPDDESGDTRPKAKVESTTTSGKSESVESAARELDGESIRKKGCQGGGYYAR